MNVEDQLEESDVAPGVGAILFEALKFALEPGAGIVLDLTKIIDRKRIVGSTRVYVHVDKEGELQIADVSEGSNDLIKHGTKIFIYAPEAPELVHD